MPAASAAATLNDHQGPAWIAKKAGYSVRSFVVQKDVPAQRLYAVFSTGHAVKLLEPINHGGEPHAAEIILEDLLGKWSLAKAEPPKQMKGDQQRPRQLHIDKQKAILHRALPELDPKHMGKPDAKADLLAEARRGSDHVCDQAGSAYIGPNGTVGQHKLEERV
eukprot:6045004-Pyramimonas_sp.AAC.1